MTLRCQPPFEADLHNHTCHSDGEYTPAELVAEAKRLGLRAVGITDHDTLGALGEGIAAGRQVGVEVVPGVEVSVRVEVEAFRGTLHLLVYISDGLINAPAFVASAEALFAKGRGPGLVAARVEALNRWFGPAGRSPRLERDLRVEDLARHATNVTRRHFALALGDLGITDRAAVTEIIGNDSPAYVPSGVPLSVVDDWLRRWPVVRVLAHPAAGSYSGESHYKEVNPPLEIVEGLIPDFLEVGLDGLEVCYPGHTPELAARVDALRQAHGLALATGGSDCHDAVSRPLGVAGVGVSVVRRLRELLAEREEAGGAAFRATR